MKAAIALPLLASLAVAAPVAENAEPGPMDNLNPIYDIPWNETAFDELHKLQTRGTDAPYGNKKGLAYDVKDASKTGVMSRDKSATWAYNWGPQALAPKFQQIPMWWGRDSGGDPKAIHAKIDKGDTPYVLGYNEPDFTGAHGGSNASPRQAYDSWGNNMFQFSDRGVKLVCPAISSWDTNKGDTGGPSGFTWLRQFASIGNNPNQFRCAAQAIHWYGPTNGESAATQAQLFKDYVARAHGVVNDIFRKEMPLWITEFAPEPHNNVQLQADFLKIVVPWLNKQDYVHRYSPFMLEYLVNGNQPSAAGWALVNS